MKVAELIEHIRQSNPKLLQGIPEDKAEALVRRVFKHMNDTLAKTEEGVVNYAGLGRFRLRKVEKEVDGRKVSRTKIGFRPANAKGEGKESHAAGE